MNEDKLWDMVVEELKNKQFKSGQLWSFQEWNFFRNKYEVSTDDWECFVQKKIDEGYFKKNNKMNPGNPNTYYLAVTDKLEKLLW